MKAKITQRFTERLTPPGEGRAIYNDTALPGFGVMITANMAKGHGSYTLTKRYPGKAYPERRTIGTFPAMRVLDARAKAVAWLHLIERGVDPKAQELADAKEAERKRLAVLPVTVAAVLDAFKATELDSQRRGADVHRALKADLVKPLGRKLIHQITESDCRGIIKGIRARGADTQARRVFGYLNRFFDWAVSARHDTEQEQDAKRFPIDSSPMRGLRIKDFFRSNESESPRETRLTDDEIWAKVTVAKRWGYPYGFAYLLLLLSLSRLNGVMAADYAEFNLTNNQPEWTIPRERMKARNAGKARPHLVPITGPIMDVLRDMPQGLDGTGLLFPAAFRKKRADGTLKGKPTLWLGDKIKKQLDSEMLVELRALAVARGRNPDNVTLTAWRNHDLRRTGRSIMSRLGVDPDVAEAVLAHKLTGIRGVYDVYDRAREKREALELWAQEVSIICTERDAIMRKARAAA